MTGALDLIAMYAMHDALRREMVHLDRITVSIHGDARRILALAAGWPLFKRALRVHRAAEDAAVWPLLRANLRDRPSALARLAAMDAEHDAVAVLITAVDAQAADPDGDPAVLGSLVDSLVAGLTGHLKHKEETVLPLAHQILTARLWQALAQAGPERGGPAEPWLLPWLLDGADAETTTALLAPLPAATRTAYTTVWLPAYSALDRWSLGSAP